MENILVVATCNCDVMHVSPSICTFNIHIINIAIQIHHPLSLTRSKGGIQEKTPKDQLRRSEQSASVRIKTTKRLLAFFLPLSEMVKVINVIMFSIPNRSPRSHVSNMKRGWTISQLASADSVLHLIDKHTTFAFI